ncbi:MAG TPA: capsule assembly Wzi family protein [Longimicrobiales bacterium]
MLTTTRAFSPPFPPILRAAPLAVVLALAAATRAPLAAQRIAVAPEMQGTHTTGVARAAHTVGVTHAAQATGIAHGTPVAHGMPSQRRMPRAQGVRPTRSAQATPAAFCGGAFPAEPLGTSPLLRRDHWAARALERLNALGLAPDYQPAQRAVPRAEAALHLRAAVAAAEGRPALHRLALGWCERFVEEFPEVAFAGAEGSPTGAFEGSGAALRYASHTGVARPGIKRNGWDAMPSPDVVGPVLATTVRLTPSPRVGLLAEPRVDESGATFERWAVAVPVGPFGVLGGRQPVAYGSAVSGAITLAPPVPLTGVQVFALRPFRAPGFLRHLGTWSAHTFLSRLREPRHPGDPWLWGANLTWRPHARLTLSGNRVAIFGGDSVSAPMTPRTILEMLWGDTKGDGLPSRLTNSFENQSASVEVVFHPPTEAVLPLRLYVEAGMEDIDVVRGLRDSPGFVAGVSVPAVPGLPSLEVGFERTNIAETPPETHNGVWYQHFAHGGGWALDEGPLGHPLGGHGWESMVFARADLLDARLRVAARYFERKRGVQNLYAPARQGRSTGFAFEALWRLRPRAELRVSGYREAGGSWNEHRFETGVSLRM